MKKIDHAPCYGQANKYRNFTLQQDRSLIKLIKFQSWPAGDFNNLPPALFFMYLTGWLGLVTFSLFFSLNVNILSDKVVAQCRLGSQSTNYTFDYRVMYEIKGYAGHILLPKMHQNNISLGRGVRLNRKARLMAGRNTSETLCGLKSSYRPSFPPQLPLSRTSTRAKLPEGLLLYLLHFYRPTIQSSTDRTKCHPADANSTL